MFKYLILLVFISSSLFANEKPIPPYLKDATITVTLKSGAIYTYSANEYAVIKRDGVVLPPPAIEKEKVVFQDREVVRFVERKKNLNRVKVLVGRSPSDVLIRASALNQVVVEQSYKAFVGFGYERMVSQQWSLGLQLSSDHSQALTLGYDF